MVVAPVVTVKLSPAGRALDQTSRAFAGLVSFASVWKSTASWWLLNDDDVCVPLSTYKTLV